MTTETKPGRHGIRGGHGRSPAGLVASIDGREVDGAAFGGKAQWLNRLVRAGFAVPPSVVITTDAYGAVAEASEVAQLLAELRQHDPLPEQAARERARVDEVFMQVRLPPVVRAGLDEVVDTLLHHAGDRMAVRSSATAEDMHGTSFAGQYRSFLDVDADGLERAVRLVWASLWHPAPRWYRRFNGIDERDIAMAVIGMPMIEAELAGVAFSVDPGGLGETMRIELVHGLGEQLVSGSVTPAVHLLARGDDRRHIDPDVARVAEMLLAVEAELGEPQDIEWATVGGELFVLQARPITTTVTHAGDGFDTWTDHQTTWTTAGVAEMLPGALAPLVWETNRRLLEEAFRELFRRLRTLPPDIDDRGSFVGRFRGQAALNLDVLKDVAGPGAAGEVEHQYFGTATIEDPIRLRRWRRRPSEWKHSWLLERVHHAAMVGAETTVRAVTELVPLVPDLQQLDTSALLAYRNRLMDLAGRTMTSEVAIASAASVAFRRLELALTKRFDADEASRRALSLTGKAGHRQVHGVVDEASSRAVFAGPTWQEGVDAAQMPDQPASPVASASASAPAAPAAPDSWDSLIETLRATPNWSASRILTGQVVDVRLAVLRRLVEDASELLDARERTKAALLRLGGEVRRVHLEIGRRLVLERHLDRVADVDYLSERELIGTDHLPTRADLSRRRRWFESEWNGSALPLRFTGEPPAQERADVSGDVLRGWGASGGRHRGRSVVLHDPDGPGLRSGDVLVTRTTDASWAPAFMRAGAIVVEEGGPLSHAAIVARELGLPAVVNVPGVVDRLADADGTMVTVDGDKGLILIEDPGP